MKEHLRHTGRVLAFAAALVVLATARASVPMQIPFSGQLEQNGAPVTSAGVDLQLGIYDALSGGQLKFKQQLADVAVYGGKFTVVLGPQGLDQNDASVALIDALQGGASRWVEVTVYSTGFQNPGITLTPRQPLLSVPAALYVAEAMDFRVRGKASVAGDTTLMGGVAVGPLPPTMQGKQGYLHVQQGAEFRCQGCGDPDTFYGGNDYGTLTVQGRVLSASNNIHLSPPTGRRVIVDSGYRAAGGNRGSVGLDVAGDLRLTNSQLECQWSACVDTPHSSATGEGATCAQLVPGYPIVGGIDVAIDNAQKPIGCTSANNEDEMRLYCCRFYQP